ncbi:MAG: ABC transporter permease [Actinomycetes bacterium]
MNRVQRPTGAGLAEYAAGLMRRDRSLLQLVGIAVVVFVGFTVASPHVFPSMANLQSIGFQFPEVGLLALGVMLSIVTGGIDLSVVAIADLSAVAMGEVFRSLGVGSTGQASGSTVLLGVAVALLVGVVCGAMNGLIIGRVGITPILATLGTLNIFGGLAIAWTHGQALQGVPSQLLAIGNDTPAGVPVPVLFFAVAAVAVALLLNRSKLGLQMTFLGANATAAKFSGIRGHRVVLGTYMSSGVLAALAGMVVVGRTASITPDYGQSYILLSVVIVVLAGVDPAGGFGTVVGVVLAALSLQMLQTGMTILGLSQFLYEAAQGVVLVAVLALNAATREDVQRRTSHWWRPRHGGEADRHRRVGPGLPSEAGPG